MRSTARADLPVARPEKWVRTNFSLLLLLLIAACGSIGAGAGGIVLESIEWPAYVARHVTHHTARGKDPLHEATWERRTIRRERYRERRVDGGVRRTYEEYEIAEVMVIESERNETRIGSPLVGEPLVLVPDGNVWVPSDAAARSVVGEQTRFGPPRVRTDDDGNWSIEDGPLLHFLGQGAFLSGSLSADLAGRNRIQLKIEEEYQRAHISGLGWMIFDYGRGMVTRLEISGEIKRKDGTSESYRTTRVWSVEE